MLLDTSLSDLQVPWHMEESSSIPNSHSQTHASSVLKSVGLPCFKLLQNGAESCLTFRASHMLLQAHVHFQAVFSVPV